MDGISNGDSNSCSSENTNTINSNSFKLQNGILMEKRVKKELIEQGILEDEPIKVCKCC